VEIGGGFRVPEIMEASGCRLVEVGTTNRTRLQDYERRVKRNESVLLKVHQSNFVQRGFVESVPLPDLVTLGARASIPVIYDIGSGLLTGSPDAALRNEPSVEGSLKAGVGVVVFSGDKLLGSIQAGFIVGRAALVEPMRKNPLYRALRLDKVRLALVHHTLVQYLTGRQNEIPLWQMYRVSATDLRHHQERLRLPVTGTMWDAIEWVPLRGEMGGGSNPESGFDSYGLRFLHRKLSAQQLRERFAAWKIPIVGYVQRGGFFLDVRTFFPGDFEEVESVIQELGSIQP
jgi:L-seryl-tRNA(Ser) seleniumtransferase